VNLWDISRLETFSTIVCLLFLRIVCDVWVSLIDEPLWK